MCGRGPGGGGVEKKMQSLRLLFQSMCVTLGAVMKVDEMNLSIHGEPCVIPLSTSAEGRKDRTLPASGKTLTHNLTNVSCAVNL